MLCKGHPDFAQVKSYVCRLFVGGSLLSDNVTAMLRVYCPLSCRPSGEIVTIFTHYATVVHDSKVLCLLILIE